MKKWFSKNSVLLAAIVLSSIAISLSIYNRLNDSANEARIDDLTALLKVNSLSTYNRDSLIRQLEIRLIQEDHYLTQLTIQSDWIIIYVSTLFVIVGLIGYASFVNRINEVDTKAQNRIDEQEEMQAVHEKEFIKLKSKNFEVMGNMLDLSSVIFLDRGENADSVGQKIMAASYFVYAFHLTEDEENKHGYTERCISLLKSAHEKLLISTLGTQETFNRFVASVDIDFNIILLDEILTIGNKEITDYVMDIRADLKELKRTEKPKTTRKKKPKA